MDKIKVMVVDDSPFQIAILRDALEEKGFEVVAEAQSLEEVISEVKRVKPDIVTMDMTIPGTDGFECTREIQKIHSDVKVVVVSAMMDDEIIQKAKKTGISGYIQKPVDPDDLALLINRIMGDEELYNELDSIYPDMFKEAGLNLITRLTKTTPEVGVEGHEVCEIHSEGIAVVLGIIGKYSGRIIFDMTNDTAQNFAKVLLKREAKDHEELLNVVAEITNMFAGNACSMINKKNKVFGLRVAPPTTFHGESINIGASELSSNYSVEIKSVFGEFTMNVGFKRGGSEWMSII